MLCLNAGRVVIGPFDLIPDKEIESTITLNTLHVIYLAKALLPQMLARRYSSRSAIIMTSSGASSTPIPGVSMYSCSKALVSNFGEALHFEVRHKIDVMVWESGSTDTKINDGTDKSIWELPTKKSVEGCLY